MTDTDSNAGSIDLEAGDFEHLTNYEVSVMQAKLRQRAQNLGLEDDLNPLGLIPSMPSDSAYYTLLTDPFRPQDYIHQSTVSSTVYSAQIETTGASYNNLSAHDTPLSNLINIEKQKNKFAALRFLKSKHRIILPPNMVYEDKDLNYRIGFFIDYLCLTPKLPGFSVILPPIGHSAPFWDFTLKLGAKQGNRPFKSKHGMIGFHVEEACMCIGQHSAGDVFFIMVDQELLRPGATLLPAGSDHRGSTALSARRRRQVLTWFLFILSRDNIGGVQCNDDALFDVDLDPRVPPKWNHAHNFNPEREIRLQLRDVECLHASSTVEKYEEFRNMAPDEWKQDQWFMTMIGLTVCSRYGQDDPLDFALSTADFMEGWARWPELRAMSFALAANIEPVHGTFHRYTADEMFSEHGRLYRSKRCGRKDKITSDEDYDALPLYDEDFEPVNVYNKHSEAVSRESFEPTEGVAPTTLLFSLSKLHTLFIPNITTPYDPADWVRDATINKYPVAFAADIGSAQTRQGLPVVNSVIDTINAAVAQRPSANPGGAMWDSMDPATGELVNSDVRPWNALFATATQLYSKTNHSYAPRAQENRTMHGEVTAAVSGYFATTHKEKRIAKTCRDKIAAHPPIDAFERIATHPNFGTEGRIEEVFVIRLDRLQEDVVSGREIMLQIIEPLCDAWPSKVIPAVKDVFVPLRPGVYQSMMKATLYPIKCVMDEASSVVDRGQLPGQTLQLEGEASKFYFLELLSICERLTAFAYTGNARVLLSALGKTLWFGRALQDGLYPCFNPSVVKFVEAGGSVAIDHRHWPTDASGRSPLRSSERCHECTYGAMFTRVYQLQMEFHHSVFFTPKNVYQRYRDQPARLRACLTLDSGLRALLDYASSEIVRTVTEDVHRKATEPQTASTSSQGSVDRIAEVKKWSTATVYQMWDPSSSVFFCLVDAVRDSASAERRLPGTSRPTLLPTAFAARLMTIAQVQDAAAASGVRPRTWTMAPLFKSGPFNLIIGQLVRILLQLCPDDSRSPDTELNWMSELCLDVFSHLNIGILPWAPDTGTDTKPAEPTSFIQLGRAPQRNAPVATLYPEPPLAAAPPIPLPANHPSLIGTRWSPGTTNCLELARHFHVQRIPDDVRYTYLTMKHSQQASIVGICFEWVRNSYNPNIKVHHLSLICAWILCRLPSYVMLQHPDHKKGKTMMPVFAPSDDAHRKKYVAKDGEGKFAWLFVYLMASLCSTSPFRRESASWTDAKPWTNPMGEKGIYTCLLRRLDLVRGKADRILGGVPGTHYSYRTDTDLENRYDRLVKFILEAPTNGLAIARVALNVLGDEEACLSLGRVEDIEQVVASVIQQHVQRSD